MTDIQNRREHGFFEEIVLQTPDEPPTADRYIITRPRFHENMRLLLSHVDPQKQQAVYGVMVVEPDWRQFTGTLDESVESISLFEHYLVMKLRTHKPYSNRFVSKHRAQDDGPYFKYNLDSVSRSAEGGDGLHRLEMLMYGAAMGGARKRTEELAQYAADRLRLNVYYGLAPYKGSIRDMTRQARLHLARHIQRTVTAPAAR